MGTDKGNVAPGQAGRGAVHRYSVRCRWTGSTGAGYEHYDRAHEGWAPPAEVPVALSADPAFRGDAARLNPEQLVVLAASSCQLLSFLAVVARARVEVLSYEDEGEGLMAEDDAPTRLTSIVLRPTIQVAAGTSEERVRHLVQVAHRECYIANSLRTEVRVEPTVVLRPSQAKSSDQAMYP
jgi:organic hydroperoxide reductase OsmC/OhrA